MLHSREDITSILRAGYSMSIYPPSFAYRRCNQEERAEPGPLYLPVHSLASRGREEGREVGKKNSACACRRGKSSDSINSSGPVAVETPTGAQTG
jgi:hypothetical protein